MVLDICGSDAWSLTTHKALSLLTAALLMSYAYFVQTVVFIRVSYLSPDRKDTSSKISLNVFKYRGFS